MNIFNYRNILHIALLPIMLLSFAIGIQSVSFAQEGLHGIAKKYGVTFPIAELGNCQNIGDCRNYCDDPIHKDDCISFAKQKGFNKENKLQQDQSQILHQAKKEFGCETIETCQIFCQKPENFDKCDSFAQKTGITGGYIKNPAQRQILQKTEESLGCNSLESCKEFCEKKENRDKCSDFANKTGLRGGEKRVGPGPQASPAYENADDRARFCREFPEKCSLLPSPTPSPRCPTSQLAGIDGTWCCDSDKATDGQTSARSKGYCQDQNGSYADFCADSIYVRDYYCTGTWDGKSLTKVHCEDGGYSCTSYIGNGCSDGACNPPKTSETTNTTSSGGDYNQIKPSPTSIPSLNQNPTPTSPPSSSSSTQTQTSPTPTAQNPTPTPSSSSSSSSSQGDGSFCEDSDSSYETSGTCKDAQGTHTDYCDGDTARDYYCTGTWDGKSLSNRHCEAGGYVCSSFGKTCSNGACVGSVQGVKAQKNIFQRILDWTKQFSF